MLWQGYVELLLTGHFQRIWSFYFYLDKKSMENLPLFKGRNINYPENIVKARETSMIKVGEIVGLSAPMNITGRPTYLSNEKESLIFVAVDIEGGHDLPLESNSLLEQLYSVIKAVKFWCK